MHIVQFRVVKCSLDHAKRSFCRTVNGIFGKIGRFASEEVVLQLVNSKRITSLLYGLEACPLNKTYLKGQGHESQKHCRRAALHSGECWLFYSFKHFRFTFSSPACRPVYQHHHDLGSTLSPTSKLFYVQ